VWDPSRKESSAPGIPSTSSSFERSSGNATGNVGSLRRGLHRLARGKTTVRSSRPPRQVVGSENTSRNLTSAEAIRREISADRRTGCPWLEKRRQLFADRDDQVRNADFTTLRAAIRLNHVVNHANLAARRGESPGEDEAGARPVRLLG